MKNWMLHIILFVCLSANVMSAQEKGNSVSNEEFQKISKEIDYSKTKNVLKLRKDKNPKQQKEKKNRLANFQGMGAILKLVAYGLIGGLFLFILYLLFSNVRVTAMIPDNIENEPIDKNEHIEEIDLESKYDLALANGDFRMALRIRYLKILQYLSIQKVIDWRFEKTNRDYMNEIRGTQYFDSFRKLSNIFEWVWYGNQEIDQEIFNSCKVEFDTFKIAAS